MKSLVAVTNCVGGSNPRFWRNHICLNVANSGRLYICRVPVKPLRQNRFTIQIVPTTPNALDISG